MATMLAEHLLKQQVYGNHACTTAAKAAVEGDELYCNLCRLHIHNYGVGLGRLYNGGAGTSGAIVDSKIVYAKVAQIVIQLIPITC